MKGARTFRKLQENSLLHSGDDQKGEENHPFVSVVIPAYNEASIIEDHLSTLYEYLKSIEDEYRWEMILVDDGSTDKTGEMAESFARGRKNIRVLHHKKNYGIGQAFKFAFNQCRGDYIVTLDIDLSYSPQHIKELLTKIRENGAKVVVASPYMTGGKISNVPWFRRTLSIWANRFLSIAAKGNVSTLTGMVRAYDARFLKSLNLKSLGMDVNPEVIHKALLLKALIEEVPAHLDWRHQKSEGIKRKSSMKVVRQIMSVLLSGFLFRPVMFFLIPGFALLLFAIYVNSWMFHHFFVQYQNFPQYTWFLDRASAAVGAAYQQFPHTFLVGGLALMVSVQLISLGILALQSKNYFEEIFYLGSMIHKSNQENERKKK